MKQETDLNLLPNQAKFQAIKIHLWKRIILFVKIIALVWVLVIILTYGIYSYFNFNYQSRETKYKALLQEYQSFTDRVVTTQQLKYKAKMVGSALDSRFEYGRAFEAVNSLFPPEVVLADLELKDNKVFAITLKADNDKTMDWLEQEIGKINKGQVEGFNSAKLLSLSEDTGVWKLAMEVTYK